MRFRVRSGDLNKIITKPMMLEDITEELLIGIVKEAVEKSDKDKMELGELMSICEVPLTVKDNCYFIESKSALRKAGFQVLNQKKSSIGGN